MKHLTKEYSGSLQPRPQSYDIIGRNGKFFIIFSDLANGPKDAPPISIEFNDLQDILNFIDTVRDNIKSTESDIDSDSSS